MNKQEQTQIMYLINLIESDIRINENLLKDYKIQAKNSLYYCGLANEKEDRIKYLKAYLQQLKNIQGEK